MAGLIPYKDIANKSLTPGTPIFEAVANETRRAFCAREQVGEVVFDTGIKLSGPLKAAQEGLFDYICGLPEEPIPRSPAPLAPSNEGQCECQPYRVSYRLTVDGIPFGNSFIDRNGPISTFFETRPGPSGTTVNVVGVTSRGAPGGACSPSIVRSNLLSVESPSQPEVTITGIAPSPDYPSVQCERPTFPAPGDRSGPIQPYPPIAFPIPNKPPVLIPIIPVPVIIPVGAIIAPKFVFDVGGLNVEFSLGGVEITVNTGNQTGDITVVQPGFEQPTLPPSVITVNIGGGGGADCCDEILNKLDQMDDKLDDIQDCVCIPESELLESFENLRSGIFVHEERSLSFVEINLDSVHDRNSFSVPGGVEVVIAGWYSFGRDGRWGDRKQLQYRNNICVPPGRDYNEFTFSIQGALTASGSVHVEKEPE